MQLRKAIAADVPIFYEQQLDLDANYMAAFTRKDTTDKGLFFEHMAKIMADESVMLRTITSNNEVAGYVVRFFRFEKPEVSYWLGKNYWGKGLATQALTIFLSLETTRPIYARVAKDNIASIRVLEKCGFAVCGEDKGFANARNTEVEEYILHLVSPPQDRPE